MTRAPLDIEKRRPFSDAQKIAILERQADENGFVSCGCGCGVHIVRFKDGKRFPFVRVEFDHIRALTLGGEHSVENARALAKKCHDRKTADDVARNAKAKRQSGAQLGQYARRKIFGSKMKSRGFQKDWRNG